MVSRSDGSRRRYERAVAAGLLLLLPACDRQRSEEEQVPVGVAEDTARAIGRADPQLTAVCDTLGEWLRASMAREPESTYGRFTGSIRGTTRHGCRFAAVDTLPPDPPLLPLDRVWEEMSTRGWTLEPAYTAEGPEGRMAGMRRGTILCVLQHYWDVGSDDERAAQRVTAFRYDVRIECFREAPRSPAGD
jgi:hypothetical protein